MIHVSIPRVCQFLIALICTAFMAIAGGRILAMVSFLSIILGYLLHIYDEVERINTNKITRKDT
jgi:Ca2+/Na+ antiporter